MKIFAIILVAICLGNVKCQKKERYVQKKLIENQIVPDVVPEVGDIKELKVSYPASDVNVDLGNYLTPTQVKEEPKVEWEAKEGEFFSLLMTDPDAPSRDDPIRREFRHWLVVNIPGSNLTEGETVFQYIGSGPPKGTGYHRYVFLLFHQQDGKINFDSPYVSDHSSLNRASTSTKKLIDAYNLKVVEGNFYEAQYDDYVPTLHAQLAGKKLN